MLRPFRTRCALYPQAHPFLHPHPRQQSHLSLLSQLTPICPHPSPVSTGGGRSEHDPTVPPNANPRVLGDHRSPTRMPSMEPLCCLWAGADPTGKSVLHLQLHQGPCRRPAKHLARPRHLLAGLGYGRREPRWVSEESRPALGWARRADCGVHCLRRLLAGWAFRVGGSKPKKNTEHH